MHDRTHLLMAPPCTIRCMAPGRGFEPRFTASKAAVLPLDDPGMFRQERTEFFQTTQEEGNKTKQKKTKKNGSVYCFRLLLLLQNPE